VNNTSASSVVDRIVEQNKALWQLLNDSSLTRAEALALIDRAFPPQTKYRYPAGSTERLQAERIARESSAGEAK